MEWTPLLPLIWAVLCSSTSSSRFNKFIIGQEKLNISASRDYCMKHYTDIVTLYNNKDCCILSEMINQLEGTYFVLGLQRSDEPHPKWSNGDKVDYLPALNLCQSLGKPLCAVNTPNDVLECIACNEKQHFMCYTNGTSNITYSLVKKNVTWYEAQSYCRKNYTDLVSIRNDGQKEEVKKRGMNSTTPFWIGLLYDDWKWADGGYSAYRDWNTGHPEENCTVLLNYEGYKGKLYSVSCGNVDNYPCCFKESENIHVITERKTWEQALDYCNKNYNGLLRIESAEDQKIVELNLRCSEKPVPGPVWMGLRQSRLFGFWVWTNGLAVEWSNWKGDRQPAKPLSNHCGAMATVEGYKWSDQDCLSSFYFICE